MLDSPGLCDGGVTPLWFGLAPPQGDEKKAVSIDDQLFAAVQKAALSLFFTQAEEGN